MRQRQRDRETETHRDTQRHRDTETKRHRDTETQRHRDTETNSNLFLNLDPFLINLKIDLNSFFVLVVLVYNRYSQIMDILCFGIIIYMY